MGPLPSRGFFSRGDWEFPGIMEDGVEGGVSALFRHAPVTGGP